MREFRFEAGHKATGRGGAESRQLEGLAGFARIVPSPVPLIEILSERVISISGDGTITREMMLNVAPQPAPEPHVWRPGKTLWTVLSAFQPTDRRRR